MSFVSIPQLLKEMYPVPIRVLHIEEILNSIDCDHNELDIPIDRYDLKDILRIGDRSLGSAIEFHGEKAVVTAMKDIIEKMSLTDEWRRIDIGGFIIHFLVNPKYPLMEINEAIHIMSDVMRTDNFVWGLKTDDNVPCDYVRIVIFTIDNKKYMSVNRSDYENG